MAAPLKHVVLIGATGTVGSHILEALLADAADDFQITVLTRQTTKSTIKPHPAISEVTTDFSTPDLLTNFKGQDVIIHAAGIPSLRDQPTIIAAAIDAGVQRFILNEFANSYSQAGLPELEQYRTPKKEVMEYAKQMSAQHPEFSWTGLATGNFIDLSLKKYPPFGMDIKNRTVRFVDDGTERISAVTLADIGIAVRGILREPHKTKNRMCHVRSVETSQVDVFSALTEEMGAEGWEVTREKSEDMYSRGNAALAKGESRGRLDLLVTQLFAKGSGRSIVVGREHSDNKLLGVTEKDIETVVKDVLQSMDKLYPDCIVKG